MIDNQIDNQKLFLGVLMTIDPELAAVVSAEAALSDEPIEVFVVGDDDIEGVPETGLGRIVLTGGRQAGAALAAAMVTRELLSLYARAADGARELTRAHLFRELVDDMAPDLSVLLELEADVNGGDVKLRVDADDAAPSELGVVNLPAGDQSDAVREIDEMTDRLWGLYENAREPHQPRRRTLWGRLRRRD